MRSISPVVLLAATALAGCSERGAQQRVGGQADVSAEPPPAPAAPPPPPIVAPAPVADRSVQGADAAGGPNVNVSAAPGVAFNYSYAYRLPNARIQAAQEAHAAMCEKLGTARCRITGMRYTLVHESDISASLEVKLDPSIARQFGKDATKVIVDAKGMLVDQQISGTDAGATIKAADRGRAELQDELDRVNRELDRPGLSNVVRDRLLTQAQELRAQMRGLAEQKTASEETLATTPMTLLYGSGTSVPGSDDVHPLRDALDGAQTNFEQALGAIILVAASLLPWIVIGALLWWIARRTGLAARLRARTTPDDQLPSPTP